MDGHLPGIQLVLNDRTPDLAFLHEVHVPCAKDGKGAMVYGEIPNVIRCATWPAGKKVYDLENNHRFPSGHLLVGELVGDRLETVGVSLSASRSAGSIMVAKHDGVRPTYMAFSFPGAEDECRTHFGLPVPSGRGYHTSFQDARHKEGRVIIAGYPAFDLVCLYGMWSGVDGPTRSARRVTWDAALLHFITRCRVRNRFVVVMGDLNIAPTAADVSHPARFLRIPGFKPDERASFRQIVAAGDLVDAYRHLHPAVGTALTATDATDDNVNLVSRDFSWRGSVGFGRSAMRLDHCFVSRELLPFVVACEVAGDAHMNGFCGSDHCPVVVTMAAGCHLAAPVPTQNTTGAAVASR